MRDRRLEDLLFMGPLLLVAGPLTAALAGLVVVCSGRPALFRQTRVGRHGRCFDMLKLRTMRNGDSTADGLLTVAGDARVTPIGRWLRATKLDELPQIWNVVRGEMSLVGPRPEHPGFVAHLPAEWSELLAARPGLIDLAGLAFDDEATLLALASDPGRAYLEILMPAKLRLSRVGQTRSSFWFDLTILGRTLGMLVRRSRAVEHPEVTRARQAILAQNQALAGQSSAGSGGTIRSTLL